MDEEKNKIVINNEYDYSNILPLKDAVSYLVKYCDDMNNRLNNLVSDDEERNKQYKDEFRNYSYKHSYGQQFNVYVRNKNSSYVNCKDYNQFISLVNGEGLNDVSKLVIDLDLDFFRGRGDALEEYENRFKISFEPYNIKLFRQSNHSDELIDSVEKQLNDILSTFPKANCIFCNKINE